MRGAGRARSKGARRRFSEWNDVGIEDSTRAAIIYDARPAPQASMKVPRPCLQRAEHRRQVDELAGDHMHDLALAFDRPVYGPPTRSEELAPLPLAEIAPHDHVQGAGFVLDGHEDDAGRRIGTLASDDDARAARVASMRCLSHVGRRGDPLLD